MDLKACYGFKVCYLKECYGFKVAFFGYSQKREKKEFNATVFFIA